MRHIQQILILLPAAQDVGEKFLDYLFNSDAGRLMLVVLAIALLANVVTVGLMLRWFSSNSSANDKVQLNLTNMLDKMNTTIINYQAYMEAVRQDAIEQELTNRTYNDRTKNDLATIADKVTGAQKTVADLLIEETTLHAQTRAATQANIGAMVDEIMTQRQLDLFQEFNNPEPTDCRWKVKLIRAAVKDAAEVQLLVVPIMKDNNFAGVIRGGGEVVEIIEDIMLPGWAIVKQLYGDSPTMGYVRRRQIVVSDLPIEDTHPVNPAIISSTATLTIETEESKHVSE